MQKLCFTLRSWALSGVTYDLNCPHTVKCRLLFQRIDGELRQILQLTGILAVARIHAQPEHHVHQDIGGGFG